MEVSVLLLTLNEEANLPRCLDALSWCDDIAIVDSGSTDGTPEIARSRNVRVSINPFQDFAAQLWSCRGRFPSSMGTPSSVSTLFSPKGTTCVSLVVDRSTTPVIRDFTMIGNHGSGANPDRFQLANDFYAAWPTTCGIAACANGTFTK